jgi:hypothetical protein
VIWRYGTLFPAEAFSLLKKIPRLRVFGVEKNSPTRIAYSSQITARSHDLDWPSAFAALRVSAQLRSPSLALAIFARALAHKSRSY